MKISASIRAVKENYFEYVKKLKYSGVDYIHVDIFQDDNFKLQELCQFNKNDLPLDIHLIYKTITREDVKKINQANIEYINIQYETLENKDSLKWLLGEINGKVGIAITAKTKLDVLEDYKNDITQILFMCSEPGVSGAPFDSTIYEKIEICRRKYPSMKLAVDGGVNDAIAEKMGQIGVSILVSGSYLSRNIERLAMSTYSLKYMNEREIGVKRMMIPVSLLPVISKDNKFIEIVNCMNKYRLGIVFIIEDDKLKGVISDGDIRRGFIRWGRDIFDISALDLLNENPIVVQSDSTMEDIYVYINNLKKGIMVVPVLENEKLIGAVDLHLGI